MAGGSKSRVKPGNRVTSARRSRTEPYLVGVGASAGGRSALGRLLQGLPKAFQAPIVAVVHLDPKHKSKLASILQRQTDRPVLEATSQQRLAPGHVYIAPPDRHLEVRGTRLLLDRGARVRFSRPSIDRLFTSAAEAYRERAVGVLLSGNGSDGTAGAREIKARGGLVIVQSPDTTEFPGMVNNALGEGVADLELPVDKIGVALGQAASGKPMHPLPAQWPTVLSMLRERFGTDFRGYRPTTLRRRLERRVVAAGQKDLASYLSLVRKDPAELERLHSEFLIKVSSFFRDSKEWTQLQEKAVRPLVEDASRSSEIRAWSVGCSTGQEPYSLAILFSEAARKRPGLRFKVFATDLDEHALGSARIGRFSAENLEKMPQALRRRYFVREGNDWRATKELRSKVVFGRHDLLRDPPLASMDLVLCRNVLIYFTPQQSRRGLQRLQYALKPGGFLFLGRSETARHATKGLVRVPGAARIFRRPTADEPTAESSPLVRPTSRREFGGEPRRGIRATSDEVAFRNLLLDTATVMLVGVDSGGRVVLWNKAAESFFATPTDEAVGKSLPDVIGGQLWNVLKATAKQVLATHRSIHLPRLAFRREGGTRVLDVDCTPMKGPDANRGGLLFVAVDMTERYVAEARQADLIEQLGKSARNAREANEALQSANEELETLNEELQSTSEEQQTLNEELESRNEELETVNEELQSLNQELNTLNDEVGVRITDADRATAYLRTILNLSKDPLIGCDEEHRVTFWNTAATKEFRLSERQALGQKLYETLPTLDTAEVRRLAQSKRQEGVVIVTQGGQKLQVEVRRVKDTSGASQGYVLRIERLGPHDGELTPVVKPRGRRASEPR